MRKLRHEITALELEQLYAHLDGRLDRVGIETQPEVAVKILDLVNKHDVQLSDYSRVIRNDVALSGRLLRLANSALFAQLSPVTSLDRACVLLGVERLRAFSLGFYLSRAATSDASHALSRRVWGESVFRGCLASAMARRLAPDHTVEAFLIGLMLDAGVPLLYKLVGDAFLEIEREGLPPAKRFHREFHALPYTHIDVIATLTRRWKLPALIARPLIWHHTPPSDVRATDPESSLRRIAFYVGALELDQRTNTPREQAPLSSLATRMLGFDERELSALVTRSMKDYTSTMTVFSGMADCLGDLDHLPDVVHVQLTRVLDETLTRNAVTAERAAPQRFRLGGCTVEIAPDQPGVAMVYLVSGEGERISCCRITPSRGGLQAIRRAFSLETEPDDDAASVEAHLNRMAA